MSIASNPYHTCHDLHVCRMPALLLKYGYRIDKDEEVSVKFAYHTLRSALQHLISKLERSAIVYDAIRRVEKDASGHGEVLFDTEEILDNDFIEFQRQVTIEFQYN